MKRVRRTQEPCFLSIHSHCFVIIQVLKLKPAEMPPSFFPEKLLTSCVADNQC